MVVGGAHLPKASPTGSRRRTDLREVLNAIRYLVRSGCEWRMLPVHFPPWQTVYWWLRRMIRRLMFRTIHDVTLMIDRARAGRNVQPGAAVIDSQSSRCRRRMARAASMAARKSSAASAISRWTPTGVC